MRERNVPEQRLAARLAARGVGRRTFMQICGAAAAAVGIPTTMMERALAAPKKERPSVIWLHFQECTGCTETLLRTSHPAVAELILDMISLDYHETLFAAAGHQAEAALHQAMERHAGNYICVIEGAIPTADGGIYCQIAGKTAVDMLNEVAAKAKALVAVGSCASFGGLPAADPNPTGAKGAPQILEGKTVLTLPGCPPSPYNLLGVVLQLATFGTLPALDELGRPLFAYARTIHEDCPRRSHFDAGRFASAFGDEGHRHGYCLYKLGCKGPQTHARCSVQQFGEVASWPIGIGHPCVGCTEQSLAFRVPLHDTVSIDRTLPAGLAPPVEKPEEGGADPVAVGVAGVVGGLIIGGGLMAAKKVDKPATGGEGGA